MSKLPKELADVINSQQRPQQLTQEEFHHSILHHLAELFLLQQPNNTYTITTEGLEKHGNTHKGIGVDSSKESVTLRIIKND